MIKFAIDYSTVRRLTGWAYDDKTGAPVQNLCVTDGKTRVSVSMSRRHDVAGTFGLKDDTVGFDLNVPDCFDRAVSDYSLVAGDVVIYSYSRIIEEIEKAVVVGGVSGQSENKAVDYTRGRHIVFLHSGRGGYADVLAACCQHRFAAQMPAAVSGVQISVMALEDAAKHKPAMLKNSSNIIVVTESTSYPAISTISPTLVQDARFVTLYRNGSLTMPLGLHNFQLNAFFDAKSTGVSCGNSFLEAVLKIRNVAEYYADLLFGANTKNFFLADDSLVVSPVIKTYVRDRVQGVRAEDIIRVHHNDMVVTVVNLSAYVRIFDRLGKDDCWSVATARGLVKAEVHLQ